MVSRLSIGSLLDNSKFTFNGISIPGPLVSITVQVKVTSDSTGRMGLGRLLERITEMGGGTEMRRKLQSVTY